jgi:hypothetical protein
MLKRVSQGNRRKAEALAAQALSFVAAEPERLGRFLALTGIGPEDIRQAAREPGFLSGVLDYVVGDERILKAFAEEAGITPQAVGAALLVLGGPRWERDAP